MGLKGAIAVLATFFLVTVFSWTSACQLSCSLGATSNCECPPSSKAGVPHSHPRLTPVCMSGASGEFSDSAYSAQDAVAADASQPQVQFVATAVTPALVTHARRSGIDTSPPPKLEAAPTLTSLRL
jgi:hypothetical protein